MEENYRRYPIGIQNFEELRNRQCVYVDKTELVYRLANTDKVYFSAVPVGLAKVYLYLRSKPIFKEKKNFSKAWQWNSWKRNGQFIRYYT